MYRLNLLLLSFFVSLQLIRGQCPAGTTISFEKISNVNIKGVNLVPLYQGMLEHMPVSAECNNRCRAGANCRAFIINYSKHSCVGIGYDKESSGISMVATDERTSYFDKICLTVQACEKAWTFERVIGRQLIGFDDRVIANVANRLRCEELCLKERQFTCRSGEYDHATLECRLSTQDRRTQNVHFVIATPSTDYFENQCAQSLDVNVNSSITNSSQFYSNSNREINANLIGADGSISSYNCGFRRQPGVDIHRADLLRTAYSEQNCEQLCEATKAFVCRSFSYKPALSQCSLNSDDTHSIGGQRALAHSSDTVYFERSNCVNLNLDCRPDQMEIQLNTVQPFNGKLYAKEDPVHCETVARSSTVTSLVMPIQGKSSAQNTCGIKADSNGKYSTTVVVQYHPLIQRKGDRIVRLVCNFETSTQIVTNNYHVLSHMEHQGSTVVNASATSPEIRLRITDANGQDVQGTKLGEQLQLRIELKNEDSALDMQATHLMAMSGHTQQQIALIDSNGCPTDPNIFPALEKLPGTKTLLGRFDAFKFADDVVVRFQVNVHFCVSRCPPLNCLPGRSAVDVDSIEDNELGAANERVSLLKEEESVVDLAGNATDSPHATDKTLSRVDDQIDALASNARTKLLNKNEENNRVRRETHRGYHAKFDREERKTAADRAANPLPDAVYQKEIRVEGLSSNEHDYQARSLYTRGDFSNPQYCASRNTFIILGLLAMFTNLIGLSICCVCYRNRKFSSHDQFYLNSITSRQQHRKQQLRSPASSHASSRQCLPNQMMSNYFSRVD